MKHPIDGHPAIALVRRSQKSIARDFLLRDLAQYLGREAFQEVAVLVVEHFFPRAAKRQNTANLSDLAEMFAVAFVLAPLQYRLPGVYRPDWSIGTTLSWFRRCMTRDTRQWYWCRPTVEIDRSPEAVYAQLTRTVKIRDTTFATTASEILCNLAAADGRKGEAARMFLDPFAGAAFDRSINDIFHVRASGTSRRKLRAQQELTASYLRCGSDAILLATPDVAKASASEQYVWYDIREAPIQWQDYVIQRDKKKEHLRIKLRDDVIAADLREIKALERAIPGPHRKFRAVVRHVERFLQRHRYATDSLEALRRYNQEVTRMIARRITATVPSLIYANTHIPVYNRLVLPITNPFLVTATTRGASDPIASAICNTTWMNFWNPFRGTQMWSQNDASTDDDEVHDLGAL